MQFKVLKITAEMIDSDWKFLADCLCLWKPTHSFDSVEENMMECFKAVNYMVQWHDLKDKLKFVEREDIIERIIKETTLTKGKIYFMHQVFLLD